MSANMGRHGRQDAEEAGFKEASVSGEDYTIQPGDSVVRVNAASAGCCITLPDCAETVGRSILIHADNGSNDIDINDAGDDALWEQWTLADTGDCVEVKSYGFRWIHGASNETGA